MKLSIKNVGKLKEADVEINGITVIAGENNTGKSTVSKALFSLFNGFYNFDNKMVELKSRDITFTLNKNESIEAKLNEINKLKGIYEISIKDVFEKDNNTKNVTISIVLES